jgi:hypothetical protein
MCFVVMCSDDSDNGGNGGGYGQGGDSDSDGDGDGDMEFDTGNPDEDNDPTYDEDTDRSDDAVAQDCPYICVVTGGDCRGEGGVPNNDYICKIGVCCDMSAVEAVTPVDEDGICDGKCVTTVECGGTGEWATWETVYNGTCGNGTVCCVPPAGTGDAGVPDIDTAGTADAGTAEP